MRKFGVCLALTGACVWLTGCGMQFGGQSSSSRGGIAVVDLDKVAAETGRGAEMKAAIQQQKTSYEQRLNQYLVTTNGKLSAKAEELKKLGDEAPDSAKLELAKETQTARAEFAKANNNANTLLSNAQQTLLANFRNELKPFLHEAANKRGLSVVIPKNDGLLLTVDPGVDITDDVIKAYLAKRPAPSQAASLPAAQAPASAPAAAQSAAQTPAAKAPAARQAAREARDFDDDTKKR